MPKVQPIYDNVSYRFTRRIKNEALFIRKRSPKLLTGSVPISVTLPIQVPYIAREIIRVVRPM